MKNTKKVVTLLAVLSIALLGSCGKTSDKTSGGNGKESSSVIVESDFIVTYKGVEYEKGADITVTMGEKVAALVASMLDNSDTEFTFSSSDEKVVTVGEHT